MTSRSFGPLIIAWLLSLASALAWGPHTEITQAALDTLGTNDALLLRLGPQTQRLTNYCWLGDYHRVIFEEPNEGFYADDYLLFPGATPQWEHFGPWLKTTYRPYFKRAVQALRTEDARNAARWIGSLVHFVEDTGAPPHALGLRLGLHSRMESWLDTNQIRISGYAPQSLGDTEETALATLLQRMNDLNEITVAKARKIRLQAELGNRRGVKPVVLECALQSSRAVADLLYTLGKISLTPTNPTASLVGTVSSPDTPGLELFPAKIMFEGTNFSTLADLAGRFEFHNLPPGPHKLLALRPGGGLARASVDLIAGKTNTCKLVLAQKPENLIRNANFQLTWASPDSPDCWYKIKSSWESEFLPLKIGQRYRLLANFQKEAAGQVLVRWTHAYEHAVPITGIQASFQSRSLTPAQPSMTFVASRDMGLVQVVLKTPRPPSFLLTNVILEPLPEEK